MIRIKYIPPGGAIQPTDGSYEDSVQRIDPAIVRTLDTAERIELTQGTRSKLALDGVGTRGRKRRNQRDSLALSKEWRELSDRAGGGVLRTLADATTHLDPNGQPNIDALRQAQKQLRQWFYQQSNAATMTPEVQAYAARIDALLERLMRRNLLNSMGPPSDTNGRTVSAKDDSQQTRLQALLDFLKPDTRTAATLHRKAMRAWATGQPEEALKAMEAAAARAPKNPRIQLDLGRLLMDEGHYAEAEWTLLTADELAPKRSGAQLALGELYMEMGQPLVAIEAFKIAVARNPSDTDAQAQLGVAYYEQGDLEKATPYLQQAIALDQQCVVARFYLAQISLQENDVLRARFQLGMVAKLSPEMDLERFNQNQPVALAARTGNDERPMHHWQLPIKAPTGKLPKTSTGPLKRSGTEALIDPAAGR